MIVQLENDCIWLFVLPVARAPFPAMTEYCKGFSPADIAPPTSPQSAWQKIAHSPLIGAEQLMGIEVEG